MKGKATIQRSAGKTWGALNNRDFLTPDFMSKLGRCLVSSIIMEAKKDLARQGNKPTPPGEKEGIPNTERFFESFSYTVLEAMSCGCAVTATYCGGPAEIITSGQDGLLVPPGNVKKLSEAIERVIDDSDFRRKLGLNARQTVIDKFSISAVIPQIISLYEQTVSRKPQKNLMTI